MDPLSAGTGSGPRARSRRGVAGGHAARALPAARAARLTPVRLLDEDPDLGAGLAPAAFERARRHLVAQVAELRRGSRRLEATGSAELLGLLLLDGAIMRVTRIAGRATAELVGPGMVVQPWAAEPGLVRASIEWRVVAPTRVALLGDGAIVAATQWPPIMHALMARAEERSQAVAFTMAIVCLQHVRLRLTLLFWHLAERFGRVTPDGIAIPLRLSHSDLAILIGAQRPTVSLNLAALVADGTVSRRADGTWLLRGEPPGQVHDLRAAAGGAS